MKVNLNDEVEFECFDIEEADQVEKLAKETDGIVYSWKTEGQHNWFQKGISIADVLSLTILSKGLPDVIDLPDDEVEEGTGN